MPNGVSLCIEVNNVGGLIWALAVVITGDSAIFQPFDPFGRTEDFIVQGNVELGNLSIVDNKVLRGLLKSGFVMLDTIL